MSKRVLTGIRPSGETHIGNYLGMIKPALELQQQHSECMYFIADQHSLTTLHNADELRQNVLDQAAMWIAAGLDPNQSMLYRQSDLNSTELAWYLSCSYGVGNLEKAHAYKDARANQKEINAGVMFYPILMAADILLFDADIVPVGKDQKQHVEMARDIAGSFNASYKQEILKLPVPQIQPDVMTIPGTDGRKMSKSYGNTIGLVVSEKKLRKSIMGIQTDSAELAASKQLDSTVLGKIAELFLSKQKYLELEDELAAGDYGWGQAKEELFKAVNGQLGTIRERYHQLRSDEAALNAILTEGANRAGKIAAEVTGRVREAIGVSAR